MGSLITVVGNSGVGKSTLTKNLCKKGSFYPILEEMEIRPFIWKFHENRKHYAVANQVDYFLNQAEQEHFVRRNDVIGIQDGGLDFGFHVFTKRFQQKGYLDEDEFILCDRLYTTLRRYLPPPDIIINLYAPLSTIKERMQKRGRGLDIEKEDDLVALEKLILDWLRSVKSIPIIKIDASKTDPDYSSVIDGLIIEITDELLLGK